MKRIIQQLVKEEAEHFCNKCGMSCKGHIGNQLGLIEAEVSGGYDSTHLGDGDVYRFSLCERCVKELIDSFKLHAKQGNYLFPDELNDIDRHQYVESELTPEEREQWKTEWLTKPNFAFSHLENSSRAELIVWLYELEIKQSPTVHDLECIVRLKAHLKERDVFEKKMYPGGSL